MLGRFGLQRLIVRFPASLASLRTPREATTPPLFPAVDSENTWQHLMLGAVLAKALMAIPAEASADNEACYWNAEGLSHSKTPPPDHGVDLFCRDALQATFVVAMESRRLAFKAVCGLIEEADLLKSREIYQRWWGPSLGSTGEKIGNSELRF